MKSIKKSPALYITMVLLWLALAIGLWIALVKAIINIPFTYGTIYIKDLSNWKEICGAVLIFLNALFISYFWLNGVKDTIYVVWYHIAKRKLNKKFFEINEVDIEGEKNRILMVYCTCNDFDGTSLSKCMKQNYKNVRTVILDDSNNDEYKKKIDLFAKENNVEVVRRKDRVGFKAGNINNYLMREDVKDSYDYVIILDSDEVIPNNYIEEALKYFYYYNNIGIVQANHVSTRNRNFFMKLFHIGVNSHWPTYQTMKHFYGFTSMLGHGAMIKRECYLDAGGFPALVAEDLCLSIELRNKGYYVAFAPNIICEEEYPIDYVAFKKRHSKWTQGNMEFIKRYTHQINKSSMKWYEKMDIILFTYNLPLTFIFSFFIFLNIVVAPLLHVDLGQIYPTWMVVPTIIFFCAPMLNDFIQWTFSLNFFRAMFYHLCVCILYGSMLTTSLVSATLGLFGKKATFIVTPKSTQKITLGYALKAQLPEIIFSSILLALSLIFNHDVLPVILIIATGFLSIILVFFSNKTYNEDEIKKIDKETTDISLSMNKPYEETCKFNTQEE